MVSDDDGLVLALDQGSHSSRAVLFDTSGDQVAQVIEKIADCAIAALEQLGARYGLERRKNRDRPSL